MVSLRQAYRRKKTDAEDHACGEQATGYIQCCISVRAPNKSAEQFRQPMKVHISAGVIQSGHNFEYRLLELIASQPRCDKGVVVRLNRTVVNRRWD